MNTTTLLAADPGEDFKSWRQVARRLLWQAVHPSTVLWTRDQQPALTFGETQTKPRQRPKHAVPRRFLHRARRVAQHRAPDRWALLYRLLWRLNHAEPDLLDQTADPDVGRLRTLDAAVRRDVHKMHAFLRFKRVGDNQFAAWFKPIHRVLPLTAQWFANRFAVMRWTIMTPDDSAHWNGEQLTFGPGVPRSEAPAPDELEDLWCAYYAATFNPARINLKAMQTEMPKQYWSNLPELAVLDDLLLSAPAKLSAMAERAERMAGPQVPSGASLTDLLAGIRGCEGCSLYAHGTRTVSGKGPANAAIAVVAEQPHARLIEFAGDGATVLQHALSQAGLSDESIYRTHAVKHARPLVPENQRSPRATPQHVAACTAWLRAELGQVRPQVIIALGPIAARSLLGRAVRVDAARGRLHRVPWATRGVIVTVAPSAVERASGARAARLFDMLVDDLRAAQQAVAQSSKRTPKTVVS